jgi:TIR domain
MTVAQIFLSYAHEDRDVASRLVTALQAVGWSVFWDARIAAGQEFPRAIDQALDQASCAVVLWSSHSVSSSYVAAEAIRARDKGILLPASLEDVELPVPFNTIQTVSLAGWRGGHEDASFRPLADAAKLLIEGKLPTEKPSSRVTQPVVDDSNRNDLSPFTFDEQRAALQLLAAKLPTSGERTDEALALLTEFAVALERAINDFPEAQGQCQDLLLTWNTAADDRLARDSAPTTRLVLSRARGRVVAGVARSQEKARTAALDASGLQSLDPIEQSEAVDALLRGGGESARSLLATLDAARGRETLAALWRGWTRIRLYHPGSTGPLRGFALRSDPSYWHPRLEALDRLTKASTLEEAAAELQHWNEDVDRRVLGQTLLASPSLACRQLALEALPPDDRWDTVLCPSTPLLFVRESVVRSCREADPDHVKALFLLLRHRLAAVRRAADVKVAYEILRAFYGVALFFEDAFFSRLIELHEALKRKALASAELEHLERDTLEGFKSFCSRERLRGADIEHMVHIPLAIQRKLAHDGLFTGYFACNARDAIALETVPHVLRLPDVVKFVRLSRINGRALLAIAKDRNAMSEYAHRLAFSRNPRAKGRELESHLSSLRRGDWEAIARDRDASPRAREQARRLLSRVHN